MVHLLVLGLLALFFSGVVRRVSTGHLFLFYRFSKCGDSQSIISFDVTNGAGFVFTRHSTALPLCADETEAGSSATKKTERTLAAAATGKAEAG